MAHGCQDYWQQADTVCLKKSLNCGESQLTVLNGLPCPQRTAMSQDAMNFKMQKEAVLESPQIPKYCMSREIVQVCQLMPAYMLQNEKTRCQM